MDRLQKKPGGGLHLVSFLFFVSASLMLVATVVVFTHMNRMDAMVEDATQNHLLAAARAASTFLTVEELELFQTGEDMERPEWAQIKTRLRQFAHDYGVLYVYYWRDYGDGRIQYIIDNDDDEEEMSTPELFFDLDSDPLTAEAVPIVMSGGAWVSDLGAYTASWVELISGLAPVFNADGSVYCAAGVDLSDEVILMQRNYVRSLRIILLSFLALSVLSGSLGMWFYNKKALQSEHASRHKSEFLATMSHEIRTPLNAVLGLSEIELQDKLPEKTRINIQQINKSASSLLEIINDILDISKIEAGGFELVPVEYETAPLLSDTINLNRVRIGSKPIAFIMQIDKDFPGKLYGDELRVKQILNNILSNAIKYTQQGSVILSAAWENASVNGDKREAIIRFSVRDTGMGIRKDDMDKLFSDYSQLDTKANRKVEGTGLGLWITKKMTEMMDGNIFVESEYGKGTTFTISIKQGLVDLSTLGEQTAEDLMRFRYVNHKNEKNFMRSHMPYGKVLVVDDLPVNLHVARGLLEPYGLHVDIAVSGPEAIEKVRSENHRYDVIFMDHMMPEMDGIEAVRIIREEIDNEYSKGVPIIALTANALAGNMEMFLAKGFNDFIAKPIDLNQLDNVLNQWVRDRQIKNEELGIKNEKVKKENEAEDEMIKKEKNPNSSFLISHFSFPVIPGVDTKRGIAMTGGALPLYCQVLHLFRKDSEDRIKLLQTQPALDTLPYFVTQVHALKSASASIGAAQLSEKAAQLEAAGKAADMAFIEQNLPAFANDLAQLIEGIKTWENVDGLERPSGAESEDSATTSKNNAVITLLQQLATALETQKAGDIDNLLEQLMKQPAVDEQSKKTLEKISDDVLMTEFGSALEAVRTLLIKNRDE